MMHKFSIFEFFQAQFGNSWVLECWRVPYLYTWARQVLSKAVGVVVFRPHARGTSEVVLFFAPRCMS